jgi:phage anti-repressor protein
MNNNNFSIELAKELVESNEQFPVDFDKAWQWLGYAKKQNAKDKLIRNFDKDFDYRLTQMRETKQDGSFSHYYERIELTTECFKSLGMMAGTKKGKEVRRYFLDCEKQLKDKLASEIKEIDALEKVRQFTTAVDLIFSNTQIVPELISGIKLNTVKKYLPAVSEDLESTRQLLINSTATDAKLMTVTELGKLHKPPLSAIKMNQLLITQGYQIKNPKKKSQKDLSYLPTDKAKDHCSITLATGNFKEDTYQQLRWYDSILSLI